MRYCPSGRWPNDRSCAKTEWLRPVTASFLASTALLLPGGLNTAFSQEPLTTVAQARQLPLAEALEGRPVKLTGVISYLRHTDKDLNFNLHDPTGGVMIYPAGRADLHPGQEVTVTGVTTVSMHGLRINDAQVIPGAMKGLPPAQPVPLAEIREDDHDGEYVITEGTIRVSRLESAEISPQRLAIDFGPQRQRLTAWITRFDEYTDLLPPGTVIRLRGVVVRWTNPLGQVQSTSLLVNGMDEVEVIRSAPPPAMRAILDIQIENTGVSPRRLRTSGVITCHRPGEFLVIQRENFAIRVHGATEDVAIGQTVEVTGFPVMGEYTVELEDATVVDSKEPEPPPVPERIADVRKIFRAAELVERDARLVTLQGSLLATRIFDSQQVLDLRADGLSFTAWLPHSAVLPDSVRPGSDLEITGICAFHLSDERRRLGRMPDAFTLHLRNADDILVLRPGPWWTADRLRLALILTVVGAGLSVVWSVSLREKNARLRREIAARRQAENELSQERRRVASELHDTLEQTLTAASLQLNAASRTIAAQPDTAASQMSLARQLIARSRQEVRDAVWDLRLDDKAEVDLRALLERVCAESTSTSGCQVVLDPRDESVPLPAHVGAQVIRLAREAIANALKHAAPQTVTVNLERTTEELTLTIADDGRGFDPSSAAGPDTGHFGLTGMKERAQRLGATCEITSRPGQGCTVSFQMPSIPG